MLTFVAILIIMQMLFVTQKCNSKYFLAPPLLPGCLCSLHITSVTFTSTTDNSS